MRHATAQFILAMQVRERTLHSTISALEAELALARIDLRVTRTALVNNRNPGNRVHALSSAEADRFRAACPHLSGPLEEVTRRQAPE